MTRFSEVLAYPLRSGVTVPAAQRGAGTRMVNMRELFAYRRLGDVPMARVDIGDVDAERYLIQAGDLLFARRSLTLEGAGQCSIVLQASEPTTWESSILRARVDPELSSPLFLYYYFRSPDGRFAISSIANQVAAAGIKSSDLSKLELPKVALSSQQDIAGVLGAFDDKIAANRSGMESSDRLIRALYGRLPVSEMTLGRIAVNVKDPVGPAEIADDECYVGLEHLDRRSLWLERCGAGADVASNKSRFAVGDVLFGKLRPYFHKVALSPFPGVCSTDILVVRAREEENVALVAACASSDAAVAAAVQASNGTKMPRAKWADIAGTRIPDPVSTETRAFGSSVEAISKRMMQAVEENVRLAATRDELLPLLMSGKITVKDAEKTVEEVL